MELFENKSSIFPTSYVEVLQRIRNIDPIKYGSTRNYINGSVTYLSPYISRGIVSTKFILSEILKKGYKPYSRTSLERLLATDLDFKR